MRCNPRFPWFLAGSLISLASVADEHQANLPVLHFDGFGTLGVVHSSEEDADFVSSLTQNKGAGHSDDWSAGVDSRIGLQVTAILTEQLSAVVQVVSEQRYDASNSPVLEWANVKYDITPDFSLRAGRIRLPTLLAAAYRKVGYVNPWVRPPLVIYNMLPITSNDGVDASYRMPVGAAVATLQAFYGRRDFRVPEFGELNARDTVGLFGTVELGDAIVSGGYLQTDVRIDAANELFDQFRQFGDAGTAIADRYEVDGSTFSLWTVGGSYDPGDWFVRGEWGRRHTRAFPGTAMGWYGSGGYRIGQFTPYATIGQRIRVGRTSDPGLDVAMLPPPTREFAAALNAGLNAALHSDEYDSLSIGTRWDFMRNVSFKLQLDHIRLDAGSQGDLANAQPGFRPGGNFNVLSATVDFVF